MKDVLAGHEPEPKKNTDRLLVHGHQAVIADVSHQLRTSLAALRLRLRLRLDVLAAGADSDTATELAAAQEEITRLSWLVDGLLAVARAEQTTPRPTAVHCCVWAGTAAPALPPTTPPSPSNLPPDAPTST